MTAPTRTRSARRAVAILALAALLPACAMVSLPDGFTPVEGASAPRRVEALEVVATDGRPFEGRSRVGTGFLPFIPLVPYGHQQLSPEFGALSGSVKNGDFPSDVADVVIEDLRAARVADWVGAPDDRLPGPGSEAPAYRLELTVEEGIYHRNITLYGLSIAGALLWIVGLPNSYGGAELVIRAELWNAEGGSLGSDSFAAKASAIEWLYYPVGPAYTRKMLKAYAEISPQLRRFVIERVAQAGGTAGRTDRDAQRFPSTGNSR